ncbi:MAG: DNA alkylation repair protein [SAR324 cluster bacterium]|nr:DNA alkylation repair protein [SAR324 cluster bacterium]
MYPFVKQIKEELSQLADESIALNSQRFFKTGPGDYGEGDLFLGIRVPVLRKLIPQYKNTTLEQILELLKSPYHEERLFALFLLVGQFSKGSAEERKQRYHAYLGHTKYINNWDLVDTSAEHIVGAYLMARDRSPLYQLVRSKDLWERRIAVLATFYFIKRNEYQDTLQIAELLLNDSEDLIHKAVGWMLREIGKRNLKAEESFLRQHYQQMPRTMLRYAIEKFEEKKRQNYLYGRIPLGE